MGSPVSVAVAELVMQEIESKAQDTFPEKPKSFCRYVDDSISAMKTCLVDSFHKHLNSPNPSIQFTVERYSRPNGIAFLDTHNKICGDGRVMVFNI